MSDLSQLGPSFEKARAIQGKLAQYIELERQYRDLQEQLAAFEADPELRALLGLRPEEQGQDSATANEPVARAGSASDAMDATTADDPRIAVPRSPTGRIQRNFLPTIFPKIAQRRLDQPLDVRSITDILLEELALDDLNSNSTKAVVTTMVKRGLMSEVPDTEPQKYEWLGEHVASDNQRDEKEVTQDEAHNGAGSDGFPALSELQK